MPQVPDHRVDEEHLAMLIEIEAPRIGRAGSNDFEDAARREGIRGYVRNQHDGSVEVVAEGDAEALLRFEMAVRRGPPGARVDDVDTTETGASNRFSSFRVTG